MPTALILDNDGETRLPPPRPVVSHVHQLNHPFYFVHNHCGISRHSTVATLATVPTEEDDSVYSSDSSTAMECDGDEPDNGNNNNNAPAPSQAPTETYERDNSYNDMIATRLASRLAIIRQEALHLLASPGAKLEDILAVMKAVAANADIQALACEKLWVLSWEEENAEVLGRTDGIALVLQAMLRFPAHARLQAGACETLQNIAATNEWNCRGIWQNGGVHLLVRAMMHFPENAKLQFCGCTTLTSIAATRTAQDTISRDFILDAGGLTAILQVFQRFRGDESITTAAREALTALGYEYRV